MRFCSPKSEGHSWSPLWLGVLLLIMVRATFILALWDRNPRPYKEAASCRRVWMVHAPLSALKGCLSNQLPPGSFDMLPLCGLNEHLIAFISLLFAEHLLE